VSLREKLATLPTRSKVGVIDRWLNELPQEDRDAAVNALRDTTWPIPALAPIFEEEGAPRLSFSTWRTYRRGLNEPR